ncbi:hypothetical protein AX16_004418 [Volvariella volvacea WC 439]|nr:hypothetical protein AX16_004418 [Volvariella volvacea WC 439]
MSFKRTAVIAPNPVTARGEATKISSSKDKLVYTNGRVVIIRDLNNPTLATTFSGHVQNATVARISPTGYYCASADVVGNVKIWDIVGEDQTIKGEYKVISGRVNDLEWDGESKRIIAVGDGKEKFGHAFMVDTGSSTGDIIGHSKTINSVSIRHQRPFRAATASDDGLIIFHHGAPYKYDKTIKTHTKFVQDVRYSPSGDIFASVGSDAKVFIYDGKTGDNLAEFTEGAHTGTIYGCSWNADSKSLSTSSADRTVKLWDVETRKPVTTWTLGTGIDNQQVGNTWSSNHGIVSLSMSGNLNVFDPRVADKPARILEAAQKSITSIAPAVSGTLVVGTADGRVLSYTTDTGESNHAQGTGHGSIVTDLAASPQGGPIYSVGFDDHVREIQPDGKSFVPASAALAAQPKSLAVTGDSTVFIAELNGVEAFRSNQRVLQHKLPKSTPSAVAALSTTVAVGAEDHKVYLYEWDGKTLKESGVLEGNKGPVSTLAFSPDGKHLASGDSSGKLMLFDVIEKKLITGRWAFHSAKINSLSWTLDSQHCASGSLDTHVCVWSVEKPLKAISIKNAGAGSINRVLWLEGTGSKSGKLASAGADGCIRVWDVTFHA